MGCEGCSTREADVRSPGHGQPGPEGPTLGIGVVLGGQVKVSLHGKVDKWL